MENFREQARESLDRAKDLLDGNDVPHLRYAALELRDALEAITYDRISTYKDEISPEQFSNWQPRKLVAYLAEIDPYAFVPWTISVELQDKPDIIARRDQWAVLGTEIVLTYKDLKTHYDALGSYLHTQSLKQALDGKVRDFESLRRRCKTVAQLIDSVLSSTMWTIKIGRPVHLDECMNSTCRQPITKRIPIGEDVVDAQCFACKAEYTVKIVEDKQRWTPKRARLACARADCSELRDLWSHKVSVGTKWRCRACGSHNAIALAVVKLEEQSS